MNRLLMAKISHICVACTDAGEGREQDAVSFANLGGSPTIACVSRLDLENFFSPSARTRINQRFLNLTNIVSTYKLP